MKIAIISDTHDNLLNLRVFFNFAKKENIETIVHCGDTAHSETLEEILKNIERLKIFEDFGEAEIGGLKIGFCHFPELAMKNA